MYYTHIDTVVITMKQVISTFVVEKELNVIKLCLARILFGKAYASLL